MKRGGGCGEKGCIGREGISEAAPEAVRRLEEVAKALGGGYCRLRMPLKPALGVRGTVAGHRLGALEGAVVGEPTPPSAWATPDPLVRQGNRCSVGLGPASTATQ